jgi:hypothetical protein
MISIGGAGLATYCSNTFDNRPHIRIAGCTNSADTRIEQLLPRQSLLRCQSLCAALEAPVPDRRYSDGSGKTAYSQHVGIFLQRSFDQLRRSLLESREDPSIPACMQACARSLI